MVIEMAAHADLIVVRRLDGSSPRLGRPPHEEWTKVTPLPSLPSLRVVPVISSVNGMARRKRWGGGGARVGVESYFPI
jgi:hypothetical protein